MRKATPRPLPPDQERLYRLPDVEAISGLRKSTIYLKITRGEFPAPIRLGSTAAWKKSALDGWLASR